jgi:hypothetical protein
MGGNMNAISGASAVPGTGGNFDPREAAMLLGQTTRRARQQLAPFPPWLLVTRAFMALVGYGAIWLSVRGQHPYQWPTATVAPVGILIGITALTATVVVANRATTGVTGRSRLNRVGVAMMAAVWVGVFAVMGALAAGGVSQGIVYGLYPATAPLIVCGLGWAAIMTARGNRRAASASIACAVVGAVALAAGPAGSWAVAGLGVCIVLLTSAAVVAWRQRAA